MFYKKRAYKNIAIFAGKLLCQSLFVSCKFSKKELWHKGFSCEFLRAPSLQKTSGWLLLFYNSCWVYNLQYSWQFSSSEKSLVGKKIILRRFFLFSISLTNASLFYQLRKVYTILWADKRFVGFWPILKISIPFQTHDFFILTDPLFICIYLRITDRTTTFPWPGERPSSHLKVTKMWFGANIKYF